MTSNRNILPAAILLLLAAGAAWGQSPGADAERCLAIASNPDLAIQHCTRAIESGRSSGRDLAVLHFSRGFEYGAKDDHDRAIADYSAAIKLDPKFADAFHNRGHAWASKGETDLAIADYDAAIKLNPKDAAPYAGRAVEWAVKGDYGRALADYDAALQLDAKSWETLFGRGRARFYSGDFKRAVADLEQAMKLSPNEYTALWLYLARKRAGVDAEEQFQRDARAGGGGGWPAQVFALYLGRTDPASVIAAATDPDPRRRREQGCEANFYVAQWHLLRGDRQRAAALFKEVQGGCPKNSLDYEGALAELRRLQPR